MYEYEVCWVSGFKEGRIDEPPVKYQEAFLSDGLKYQTLFMGNRPVWDDMTNIVKDFYPTFFDHLKENDYTYSFEVRFEFKEKDNDEEGGMWAYVLYIKFEHEAEYVHFMIWNKSQSGNQ